MQTAAAPTLLVVEDEPSVRLLLRVVLEGEGYHVLMAEDGTQAIRLLATGAHPQLLVLDMHTPGADAPAVVAYARDGGLTVPALILSGRDDAVHAFPAGMIQGFVAKPFDVDALLGRVRRALRDVPACGRADPRGTALQ